MTILWSFSYNSLVRFHGKKNLESHKMTSLYPNPCYKKGMLKSDCTVPSIDVRIYHEGADENMCPKDNFLASRGLPSDDKR